MTHKRFKCPQCQKIYYRYREYCEDCYKKTGLIVPLWLEENEYGTKCNVCGREIDLDYDDMDRGELEREFEEYDEEVGILLRNRKVLSRKSKGCTYHYFSIPKKYLNQDKLNNIDKYKILIFKEEGED